MNRPPRIVACALAVFLTTRPALALNDTITVTVGTGTTKTANLISFSGGNVISEAGICDPTTANQCASVSAGGLLSVAATLNAETVKVIGAVNQGTSPWAVGLNTTPTIANGNGVVPTIAGAVYSSTNGAYFNQLQGNAVLSATNGGYQNILQGNAALSATNGLYANLLQGNAVLSASNPLPANLAEMGGTAINSGCVASLSSVASTTIPATVCGAFGAWVLNATAPGQAAMAASSPVVLASNQSVGDPCTFQTKTNVPISTASGTTALVTGVSAKKVYVCSLALIAPSAVSVSLAEGSSATCGTSNQAAVIGVATNGTAANGMPLAANGGLTLGSGTGTVAQTATAANYLCLFQSGTAQLAGNLTFVQQ